MFTPLPFPSINLSNCFLADMCNCVYLDILPRLKILQDLTTNQTCLWPCLAVLTNFQQYNTEQGLRLCFLWRRHSEFPCFWKDRRWCKCMTKRYFKWTVSGFEAINTLVTHCRYLYTAYTEVQNETNNFILIFQFSSNMAYFWSDFGSNLSTNSGYPNCNRTKRVSDVLWHLNSSQLTLSSTRVNVIAICRSCNDTAHVSDLKRWMWLVGVFYMGVRKSIVIFTLLIPLNWP